MDGSTNNEIEDYDVVQPVDVRQQLKNNLLEEFRIALSRTNLTDNECAALIRAVSDEEVTASAICQILTRVEEEK
jgi:hypothetical protein